MSRKVPRRSFLATTAAALAAALTHRLGAGENKPSGESADAGTTAFALDLYAKLRNEKGNVFVSPFSIATALAMTAAGAKGETLDQMRKVLHLPVGADAAFEKMLANIREAPGAKKGIDLTVANAIWAQKGYPWRDEFRNTVQTNYGAAFKDANFAIDSEAARNAINAWVEEITKKKITELMPPGVINSLTRMVLANAVHFKGKWEKPFIKAATKDAPFTRADGTKKDVPLMAQTGRFLLTESDDWQAIDLPYEGSGVSMVVVLPRKPDGLAAVEKNLKPDLLAKPTDRTPASTVQVYFPRFMVEKQYALNNTLKAMGMVDAFDSNKADFSGMVTSKPEGPLYISHVAHKTFVDVNEEGTEAAAATGVAVGVRSAAPAPPKVFRADHPFLYAIRSNPTGTILFLGRYEAA